jgi:hypothetical protein
VAQRILDELARGRTLKAICRDAGMPNKSNVFAWAKRNRHGFGDRYRAVAHVRGRGACYTPALAERICDGLRAGRALADICEADGMPSDRVVRQWIACDHDGFRVRHRQARDVGYLALADEIVDIADRAAAQWLAQRARPACERHGVESLARVRLRIAARCALLARILPRVFARRRGVAPAPHDHAALQLIDGRTRGLPSADGAAGAEVSTGTGVMVSGLAPRSRRAPE